MSSHVDFTCEYDFKQLHLQARDLLCANSDTKASMLALMLQLIEYGITARLFEDEEKLAALAKDDIGEDDGYMTTYMQGGAYILSKVCRARYFFPSLQSVWHACRLQSHNGSTDHIQDGFWPVEPPSWLAHRTQTLCAELQRVSG